MKMRVTAGSGPNATIFQPAQLKNCQAYQLILNTLALASVIFTTDNGATGLFLIGS